MQVAFACVEQSGLVSSVADYRSLDELCRCLSITPRGLFVEKSPNKFFEIVWR